MGRRITTTSTNGVRRVQTYGLDPNAVAEQSGGDPHTRYTFGLGYDTPLAMSTATATAFFEQDALSSVTSLTNTAGAITGRTSYDTYGQITSQTGQVSPYTYTGREHEPTTDLYHYRARWYDPATGTFTSEDPVKTANLYPYAAGSPTTTSDPTGAWNYNENYGVTSIINDLAKVSLRQFVGKSAVANGVVGGAIGLAKAAVCGANAAEVIRSAGIGFVTGAAGGLGFGSAVKFLAWRGALSATTIFAPILVGTASSLAALFAIVSVDDPEDLPWGDVAGSVAGPLAEMTTSAFIKFATALDPGAGEAVFECS
jgi:RHS repeat-associated protein